MELLENLILENEKNKKKTLINLIDFQKSGAGEAPAKNIQFKVMNLGVLIEGDSISHCLDDDLKDLFRNIVKNYKSVVCCRCSPKQKAEMVGFVKKKSNEVTLAIGDGGNDIAMIKIANIGVGIFGKEGYQAAFNADYAISQFKYLKRLIFVHGRNSLLRNSYFIYLIFFKNVLFTLTQLWFCFFSGFSGQVIIFKLNFFI
jgi:magnesium-transporting ATPase (P-type)